MSEGTLERAEEGLQAVEHGELGHAMESAPGLLPGELRPHPSPFKYVVIAVVLCVVTATEVAVSYLEGEIPDGLIITLLMMMAIMKFWTVAAWYMHLQTDKPIFRRFFVLGIIAAVILYTIVLATFHVFA
ncbi:MAG TPA: cytochrome C oxidase subunit IV family protein [Acidimicrobiia bacterium]|nr:cytochrome C oxidase subunit IV family protein [Acidimicrobiia bacterium]